MLADVLAFSNSLSQFILFNKCFIENMINRQFFQVSYHHLFFSFSFLLFIFGCESVYKGINCWCYRTHLEASGTRGVCLNLTDVQLRKTLICVSDSVLLMPVVNEVLLQLLLFLFFLQLIFILKMFHPSFHSSIRGYFSNTDSGRESVRRSQLYCLVSCTTSTPTGMHRLGGCDVSQGGVPLSLTLSLSFSPCHSLFHSLSVSFKCSKAFFICVPSYLKNDKHLLPPLRQVQVGLNLGKAGTLVNFFMCIYLYTLCVYDEVIGGWRECARYSGSYLFLHTCTQSL